MQLPDGNMAAKRRKNQWYESNKLLTGNFGCVPKTQQTELYLSEVIHHMMNLKGGRTKTSFVHWQNVKIMGTAIIGIDGRKIFSSLWIRRRGKLDM